MYRLISFDTIFFFHSSCRAVLWIIKFKPTSRLENVRIFLEYFFDRKITRPVLSRLLTQMGWSGKIPTEFQIQKYTLKNMIRYVDYLKLVQNLDDWRRLKFLDESHIVSSDLRHTRVLGLKSKRVYTKSTSLKQSNASITILLNPSNPQEPNN